MKLENILVPKHEVLGPEEAKRVLAEYDITKDDMPKIKKDDAAIKELKAEVGDVIKITRNSPTAGESLYYRIVVP